MSPFLSCKKSVIFLLFLILVTPAVASVVVPCLERGWTTYRTLLIRRPLLTKSVTSAVIFGVSDCATQVLEQRLSNKDLERAKGRGGLVWKRAFQSSLTGFVWSGPSAHVWYNLLEKLCGSVRVTGALPNLVLRLVLDSIIFSPVTIAGFFCVNTIIQGGSKNDIGMKLSTKWAKAVVGAWSFWPFANIINFSIVPLQFRVLYSNVMALFWSGYLSYVSNSQKNTKVS